MALPCRLSSEGGRGECKQQGLLFHKKQLRKKNCTFLKDSMEKKHLSVQKGPQKKTFSTNFEVLIFS
jgi:hypothetical protein